MGFKRMEKIMDHLGIVIYITQTVQPEKWYPSWHWKHQ